MGIFDKIRKVFRGADKDSYILKYKVQKKRSGLGSGGNGDVKKAICIKTGDFVALKSLNNEAKNNKEKMLRFEDEINTMLQAGKQIDGIIPIIDYSLKGGWYAMPIAESIKNHCKNIDDIVEGVLQVAETLAELHDKGISHRDIKPDNMLFYNERWVLCDFGLVDIPNNPHNLTKNSKRVGAIKTIAPEMSRNAKDADGKKADVYSLAKTLWILLTKNDDSFEGHYDVTDNSMSLHRFDDLREEHLIEIDELLEMATRNAPEDRPTMEEFVDALNRWKKIKADSGKQQVSNWNFLKKYLFHGHGPQRCCWEDPVEIKRVMNLLSALPLYSHVFFPDKGWMAFKKVEIGAEPVSLDVYTDFFIYRVKLGKLYYENFLQPYWNYFILESEPAEVKVGAEADEYYEQVVEDKPGHYVSAVDAVYGVYDYDEGGKFPEGAKLIIRCLKGKILIVLKHGPYNMISNMDDGRHNNCSIDDFRGYIEMLQKVYAMHGLMEKEVWRKLFVEVVDGCPFKPELALPVDKTPEKRSDPDFVKNNWETFDFSSIISKQAGMPIGKAKYRFVFHHSTGIDIFKSLVSRKESFLCKDGFIRELDFNASEIFEATDRKAAITICRGLEEEIDKYCEGKVMDIELPYFSVDVLKVENPDHLFTQDEIKTLMVVADDRVDNTLVIDEEGYAQILTERAEAKFYPVINETWCERRKYVGKYSNLSDLQPAYHYSLGKFRDYLTTGVGQPTEDYDEYYESEEELLTEINQLMK